MNSKSIEKFVAEALAIEAQEAKDAGALGFMARAMALATMPHREFDGVEFVRSNGAFTLTMLAPSKVGLPYGSLPRLLVSWVTTEAVRTKERELELGDSLSDFMRQLDLVPTGGRWGSITRLKEQTRRLFSSTVSCIYDGDEGAAEQGFRFADRHALWWDPKRPEQKSLWRSTVTLSQSFFEEVTTRPVPVDMRALKALRRSPMALDMYCWITYRMSYLRQPTLVPWEALQMQFGADYADTPQGRQGFKRKVQGQLRKVLTLYPEAKVEAEKGGLRLKPSKPHIARLERASNY